MNQMRYIITRPCLQEGSLRLLKYLDGTFPESGPAQFVGDRGREYTVQVDRAAGRVWGLRDLYHDGNLGVNDVLMITHLAPGRYQVEAIVKPHPAPLPSSRLASEPTPEARRVVVTATPHVREVRLEQPRPQPGAAETPATVRATVTPAAETRPPLAPVQAAPTPLVPVAPDSQRPASPRSEAQAAAPIPTRLEDQLAELSRLTGYRLTFPAPGVARLAAELGAHGYTVQLALNGDALRTPAWREGADYAALITTEAEHPQNLHRLTREALAALIEHARLAPLSPIDLRGYWKAGNLDLASAASISELVGAHLAQRGAFSFVLLTLASQPAHSIVSAARLAERLGSGVNTAELHSILDTLTRAPFLALTPLPGGQYLLRGEVRDLLADLAEYADGVRRRLRQPAQPATPTPTPV
ncbi:hypothetical protein HNQ10_001450 [Deinococcus metallilatus]|uniref:Uncharacterized protein n=2 Tax=Deinococcus metallilatus TaxID=1211322 RepID=A0ABR6MRV8_9DEIO|nr:hypothetical protein [Deinococcus metallilatus]GMA15849.1 hypothetical protein GCM10025871_21800 [Deinococcus metallilatus]